MKIYSNDLILTYKTFYKQILLRNPRCLASSSAFSNYKDEKFQYLQRSIVPTYHFQKSLPRLPIPSLSDTCTRYIDALRPILPPEDLERTTKIVEKFKNNEGAALHAELVENDKKNKHTSYISGPWFEMYLKSRTPLVLNYNPALAWKPDPQPEYNDQIIRASNLLISSLRFYRSLQEQVLEPDVYHLKPEKSDTPTFRKISRLLPQSLAWYGSYLMFKAFPLDMSQFTNLFCSTRIPRPGKDEIKKYDNVRHIVALKNGHFYAFDLFDADGSILPPDHLHGCISYICKKEDAPPTHPVTAFTAEERDTWAHYRQKLIENGNEDVLRIIDSALYCLVLDDRHGDDKAKVLHTMLDGPIYNRWFDKCFQLIVSKEGNSCINFEHSWGDGVAVLRFFNEVFDDSTKNHFITPESKPAHVDDSAVRHLEFKLNDEIKAGIDAAQAKYKNVISLLDINFTIREEITRESLKKCKLSPDSVVQLAFQMAYYKVYGKIPPVYESCSTAAYKHGRTETVRPATTATKACIEAFHRDPPPSAEELRALMANCSKVHNKLTVEAAMGKGFDRHLFALKHLAETKGMPIPDLYKDPSYAYANHFNLSTSTLYGHAFSAGGFGPVVQDGFGLAYGIFPSEVAAAVTSYSNKTNGKDFIQSLNESILAIHRVLGTSPKTP